ncbi:hypothetical protein [Paenibacillus sp. BAC0078]
MAKSKTTSSFRFDDDFIDLLNTWSFVSKKEKSILLQEAFREFTNLPQNADIAKKVELVTESLKEN